VVIHACTQAVQIALFTALSSNVDSTVCLPEGPAAPSLDYCVPKSAVARVNLPKSSTLGVVTQEKADLSFLSQQLCILEDNSAELGRFFADPGHASVASLAAARTREVGKFWTADPNAVATAAAFKASAAASSQYRVNDTLTATGAPGNVFILPGATFSGVCGYTNVVGFGLPLPAALDADGVSTCLVPLDDGALATACGGSTLSATNLVTNLRLAQTKASEPAYIAVSVSSQVYRSAVGAAEVAVTGATATVPGATYSAATGVCTFAVAEAHFTLTHDGAGSLTAASVALVFADAVDPTGVAATATATGAAAPAAAVRSLRQKFSVAFIKTGETAVPKSGAPGYVVGAPLLAGVILADPTTGSTKSAVSRLMDGLPVPAAGGDGRCGVNNKSPVLFGMSQFSSCAVPLTRSGLQAFCEGTGATGTIDAYMYALGAAAANATTSDNAAPSSSPPLPAQLMGGLLYATTTTGMAYAGSTAVVAGWADASYLNLADWRSCSTSDTADCGTEVAALAAPTTGMTWTAATGTCSNVPVGIALDVLTAKVGTMNNPQARVARVGASWRYASWTYADPFAAASTRQNFMLASSVRFVEMDQDSAEGVTPASPPIFPSLPQDFFYPFLSAAGPAGGRAAGVAAWWIALAAAFAVACITARGTEAF